MRFMVIVKAITKDSQAERSAKKICSAVDFVAIQSTMK